MSRVIFVVLSGVSFFFFYSCFQRVEKQFTDPPPTPETWSANLREVTQEISVKHPRHLVSASQCLEIFNENRAVFIDVRSPQEQAISSIPGALKTQPGPLNDKVSPWKDLGGEKPLIVYCTVGERSAEFKNELRKKGWAAFNLIGGICAWTWEGGPLVDNSGQKTQKVHVWSEQFKDCLAPHHEAVTEPQPQ